MTMVPRIRRNPRDRTRQRDVHAPVAAERPTPIVAAADATNLILAVVSLDGGRLSREDRELMGAARLLADLQGGAVVMVGFLPGETEFRARPDQEGADRVVLLRHDRYGNDLAETRVSGVLAAADACSARHILFTESFVGAELARRVAARLGDRPAFNVHRFSRDTLSAEIDAGVTEVNRSLPRVVAIAPGMFAPVAASPRREARAIAVDVAVSPPCVRSLGILPFDSATVPLAEADFIISAGSGLTDWESYHLAAMMLGAAEGGSRVVCDTGLLPRDRQIGASGLLVKPRCYLAFGIAGASQHLQGITEAEHVIAVNTDLRAEMVKRANLAIVADAQVVLPALLRRAATRRDAQRRVEAAGTLQASDAD